MSTRTIRTFGDPVLRERAREVEKVTDLHRALIDDMIATMRQAPGVGLAATQVGVLDRLFVWEVDDEHGVVINPVIVDRSSDTAIEDEGCLSLPGLLYPVERATSIIVQGLDAGGNEIRLEASDLLARVCQHEIDHLDGVLFIDRLPDDLKRDAVRKLRESALGLTPVTPSAEVHPR